MIQDIVAALISFFLLDPLQSRIAQGLQAARAPEAIVRDLSGCVTAGAPALAQRALGEPGWAVSTVVSVWIGGAAPERVLVEAVPSCAPAVRAALPFLRGVGA